MNTSARLGRLRTAAPGLLVIVALVSCVVTLTIVGARGRNAPASEAQQVQQIAAGLHCPVCKDLSVADSPAPLAQQMRQQIAEKVHAGQSAEQIRAGFVAAYGESVLMTPPKHGLAGSAYQLPLIVLALGVLGSLLLLRRWLHKPESDAVAGDTAPLSSSQRRAVDAAIARLREEEPTRTADEVRRRELLHQLRDLDDDRAAGKLTDADHARLREPVEREAAAVLHRVKTQRRTAAASSPPARSADAGASRWRRRTVVSLAFAAGLASVTILLIGAISPRSGGQTISGDPAPGPAHGSASDSASASEEAWQQSATPEQLTAIDAAVTRVRQNPKDVNGHLALADAYAAAGASQLAAVEYLAVAQLDPANAEANTYLALLAYEAGQAAQGKTMVDRVLATHPNYPEALYVRGLILLVGLHQPQAAERDLTAYLAVAPTGSYRTAVETLLVLARSQDRQ